MADCHNTAVEKGFWEPPDQFINELNSKLLLIVSEAVEAMETLRIAYPGPVNVYHVTDAQLSDFLEEVADIVIRAFDLVGSFGENFGEVIRAKMATNRGRPPKHAKRF